MTRFLLAFILFPLFSLSSPLPDSIVRKIDSLFRAYHEGTPGFAVSVIQNGELVFKKGYGMANLEFNIPVSPQTVFHIASESKQYVAFCILLLEKQKKLSLDDDIRQYLDFVPDFGQKITIRHLIYHTSGLRDQWQLLANAGWQLDDVITEEHVNKLIAKQKALNFPPGDEFLYCNTGYTLLGEIVRKVSGLSLRDFANKNIFQPLGMTHTHFNDDYQEIVPNRASSYSLNGKGGYEYEVLSYSIAGATSLLTTVEDEAKWLDNLETGSVGGKDLVMKMLETGTLNDGRKLQYAFALTIDQYKGWTIIGHGGADAGFRTFACRFPEKKIGIVVFSNLGNSNPSQYAKRIADILIPGSRPLPEDKYNYPAADTLLQKKFAGMYYSERGDIRGFAWEKGQLRLINFNIPDLSLVSLKKNKANQFLIAPKGPAIDQVQSGDSVQSFRLETSTTSSVFQRMPSTPQQVTDEFAGRYYGSETEAFYTITEKNGVLQLEHRKFSTVPLKNIAPDQFTCSFWWMSDIRFLRDANHKIIAFEVNAGRIQHLRYDKVSGPIPIAGSSPGLQ